MYSFGVFSLERQMHNTVRSFVLFLIILHMLADAYRLAKVYFECCVNDV